MAITSSAKSIVKNILPRPLYLKLRRNVLYGFQDFVDTMTGRRPELVPPKRMIYIGGNEFVRVGNEFFEHFKTQGGVQPDHAVLDIGCGIGRMARPFVPYLSPKGRLEGFDIDKSGVDWCSKNISAKAPNFRFQWADIYNKNYNVSGSVKASEFCFPYVRDSFDFAFATSVFTHMFPSDVSRYLNETARVLKPGGTCLLTYFLWNPESKKLIDEGKSKIDFRYEMDDVLTQDKHVPEDAICLKEHFIADAYAKAGLEIQPPIRFGSWSGRPDYLSFQDIVVARKKA